MGSLYVIHRCRSKSVLCQCTAALCRSNLFPTISEEEKVSNGEIIPTKWCNQQKKREREAECARGFFLHAEDVQLCVPSNVSFWIYARCHLPQLALCVYLLFDLHMHPHRLRGFSVARQKYAHACVQVCSPMQHNWVEFKQPSMKSPISASMRENKWYFCCGSQSALATGTSLWSPQMRMICWMCWVPPLSSNCIQELFNARIWELLKFLGAYLQH